MAMSAVFLRKRLAEIAEQPLGDAPRSSGEVDHLGHALRIALFALGEEFDLPRGHSGRIAIGGVSTQSIPVPQSRWLLGDRARLFEPGQRLDDSLARFTGVAR